MRNVPSFDQLERGAEHLLHGHAAQTTKINGALAQPAGTAIHRALDDSDARPHGPRGALVSGAENRNQRHSETRGQMHGAGVVGHHQPAPRHQRQELAQ